MKLTTIKKGTLALIAMMATTATTYAYEVDAKDACAMSIISSGYEKLHDIRAVDKGHNSYKVTGTAKSPDDNKRHNFVCNYRHGSVKNWTMTKLTNNHNKRPSGKSNSHHSSKHDKVMMGAGILAIAAIAAAANNEKHKHHATGGNPFHDRRYLKRECRHNIKHHIEMAKRVKITSAHLHNRKLSGSGIVVFDDGYERALTYTCDFDRRGRIHDGHYHFSRR